MPFKDDIETCLINAFLGRSETNDDGPQSLPHWTFDRSRGLWAFPLGYYDEMSGEFFDTEMSLVSRGEMETMAAEHNLPLPALRSQTVVDDVSVKSNEECTNPVMDEWYEQCSTWHYCDSHTKKRYQWTDYEILWEDGKPIYSPTPAIGLELNGEWYVLRPEDDWMPTITFTKGEWKCAQGALKSGMLVDGYICHILDTPDSDDNAQPSSSSEADTKDVNWSVMSKPAQAAPQAVEEEWLPKLPGNLVAALARKNMKRRMGLMNGPRASEDYNDRSAKRRARGEDFDAFTKDIEPVADPSVPTVSEGNTCADGSFAGKSSDAGRAGIGYR